MKLCLVAFGLLVAGCGGATAAARPESPPSSTSATTISAAVVPAQPELATLAAEPVPSPPPVPTPEAAAERCDGGWVCVKVSFATRRVEKRETKLFGDPKIESTWSKTSDGRAVAFDDFSKGPVELVLRHLPNGQKEVVVRLAKGGAPIVLDTHDGSVEGITHVGAIATEQDGALLIDLRYMR
jgi:hypothetical protein